MDAARLFDDVEVGRGETGEPLFEALLKAESEEAVIGALQSAGYWEDEDCWAVLGDEENNFSTASNQQTDPTTALVEKVINAVDAMLMSGAYEAGVDPQGPSAPRTMAEAVEAFYGVRNGRLGDLTTKELKSLAESVQVVATGSKDQPCYLVVDRGEGQTPNDFARTFLSVAKSNKLRIPFVQGKYNSGGLGVLQFCGRHNLQLIASKRHPRAPHAPNDDSAGDWGFTVIRRQAPSDNRRSSMYVYLAPGGTIPRFHSEAGVHVLPRLRGNQRPEPYAETMTHGSVVKVYDYRWKAKSIATTEARFEFEKYLHAPCLPFRVTETRDYRANYFSTTVSGVWTAIMAEESGTEDGRKVEAGYPAGAVLQLSSIGSLEYKIVVFRSEVDPRRVPHGVFFTVNGQVHGSLPADFVSRRLQFDYLRRHLFVSVDCSGMDTTAREDFFMASRDRLRHNETYDELIKELESELRQHPGLRELNAARRSAALAKTLDKQEDVLATLDGILRNDPNLRALFGVGDRLVSRVGPATVEEYKGLRFPTYFRLKGGRDQAVKCLPLNRTCVVEMETDAANDYFDRMESPGQMDMRPDVRKTGRLWNGIYTARLVPPEGAEPGETVEIAVQVTDPDREVHGGAPFLLTIRLEIAEPEDAEVAPSGASTPKRPANGRSEAPRLALPEIAEIRKDDWEAYDPPFTDTEVLRVARSGSGTFDFMLNLDNRYLIAELRNAKQTDHDLIRYQFKWGMTLCALGQLHYLKQTTHTGAEDSESSDSNGIDEVDLVNRTIAGVGMVIVPIIRNLFRGPEAG